LDSPGSQDSGHIFFGHARLAGILVALTAGFTAFVLPFFFPGKQPVYSAAYVAGANNKIAAIGLALLATFMLLWAIARLRHAPPLPGPRKEAPLSPATLLFGALAIAAWTALFGWAIVHADIRYGESTYFIERARDVFEQHLTIYTQLEFPYGPLLLMPPVWIARVLGAGIPASYFAWLAVLNGAGVLLAGYVLNALSLSRTARRLLFALCCFEQLHPLLGANYSLGKFMLPFAVLVCGTRRRTALAQALTLAAGDLLVLLVSPELGVGLAAGIVIWALASSARTRHPSVLLSCLAPFAGTAAFLALYGQGFLARLGNASAGALNLVIDPRPDLFVFIAALVWFAPLAVARSWSDPRNGSTDGPRLVGLFILSLGLLPGALGRSDPLHVFFNGFGFLILSMVGLDRLGRTRARIWYALVLLLGLQVQLTNLKVYLKPLAALPRALRHPESARPDFNVDRLRLLTHGERIATPALLQLPYQDELALRRAGQFDADRTDGIADIWDATGEREKIDRLRHLDYALLSTDEFGGPEGSPNADRLKRLLRFGYRYRERYPPYIVGQLLRQELAEHWQPIARFGNVILYRRIS
jgi:hypothetical protein